MITLFFEVFSQAIDSIKSNKMRTFLTMLGVVIGVASVIIIFSAGNAGKTYINGLFGKLGANIINVSLSSSEDIEDSDRFTLKDIEYLKDKIPELTQVQYYGNHITGSTSVNYGSESKTGMILGILPEFFETRPIKLTGGRLLNQNDIDSGANVAVLPEVCVKGLFGNFNPIGKKITLQDDEFGSRTLTVVGTMDFDIGVDMTADELSDQVPGVVAIPFTTFQSYYQTNTIDQIELGFPKDADATEIAEGTKRYLELHSGRSFSI